MLIALFTHIGAYTISLLSSLGMYILFIFNTLCIKNTVQGKWKLLLIQLYSIGASSMPLISIVAFFTGLVLGLQAYYTLIQFGSEVLIGTAVALTLIRELSPVLAGLMIVARVGSATTAELAVMRISAQIDALHVMNINPLLYLVRPKILAFCISLPLLNALFSLVGIFSAYLIGVEMLGISSGAYFDSIATSVQLKDIMGSFIKSLLFGMLIGTVCSYIGYSVHHTTDSMGALAVSNATTKAVVNSSVLILIADYIITSFLL